MTTLPILLMASAGLAQTQWNNAAGGLWNEPFNWSLTNVPLTSGESAQFDLAGTYTATIAAVSPNIDSLLLTNPAVTLGINSGRLLVVDAMHNDGLVVINANGLSSSTFLRFDASTTLTGTGTVTLNRFGSGARFETASGITVTNGSSHTINGFGDVRASLINEGLISAGSPGLTLQLSMQNKSNNAIVEGTNGGELAIFAITLTQGLGGVILADGGDVVFDIGDASTIIGGSLNTINGGTITREASGTITLEDVTNEGTLDINSAGVIAITGAGLTNPGEVIVHAVTISSSAILRFHATGSLMGSGRVHLNRAGAGARLETLTGMTVTNTASHTVDGLGDIRAVLVNDGLVSANVSGETLMLSSSNKTNNAVIEATDGGELALITLTLTQSPAGVLLADGGDVVFDIGDSSTIIGGTLDSINGGTMTREASGTTTLVDVTNDGTLGINNAGVIAVAGSGMNNDGTIIVNVNGVSSSLMFRFDATGTLGGSGSIVLNRAGSSARVEAAADVVMTHASTHTIEGFGEVRAELVNEGLITANAAGETLQLSTSNKTNIAVLEATNGGELGLLTLTIFRAPAGVIRVERGAFIAAGRLDDDERGFDLAQHRAQLGDAAVGVGECDDAVVVRTGDIELVLGDIDAHENRMFHANTLPCKCERACVCVRAAAQSAVRAIRQDTGLDHAL